jgi:peptidoglycan/LPS O-acetylase OafA/YrhL
MTLFAGVTYQLPGVFAENPYRSVVNGSLWTLPREVRLYVALGLLWLIARLLGRYQQATFRYAVIGLAVMAMSMLIIGHLRAQPAQGENLRLFALFFTGASFYLCKDRITLVPWIVVLASVVLLLGSLDQRAFYVAYHLSLAYLVLGLAYLPAGWLRRYNQLGDYSYGMYIYAFPVQQSLAALMPGISVERMVLLASGLTGVLAVLSWHLLEARALRLKQA